MAVQRWVVVLKIERARGSFLMSMAGREEEVRSKEPNGGLYLLESHTANSPYLMFG